MKKYYKKVDEAQSKLFGNSNITNYSKNTKVLKMPFDDLNKCSLNFLSDFLKSNIYVVLGGSYIKGPLVNFLVDQKAINIHVGVAPYYNGTDCNFWALYEDNPHLVGATIYMLSEGLDTGKILYHALSEIRDNPFLYTMSTVKSAFNSLADRIANKTIFNMMPIRQDKNKEIRYSKKKEFTEKKINEFSEKNIDLNKFKFKKNLYVNPFILKK